jgi:hypothetical protein
MFKKILLKLAQRFLMAKPRFAVGDLVQHLDGDEVFAVVDTYYDEQLKAHLFIMDATGKIFGVEPNFYKLSSNVEKIYNANY